MADHPQRARLKVTVPALAVATDLLRELLAPGQRLLGHDAGATHYETIAGHRLIAYRLECGGVDIREIRR